VDWRHDQLGVGGVTPMSNEQHDEHFLVFLLVHDIIDTMEKLRQWENTPEDPREWARTLLIEFPHRFEKGMDYPVNIEP
jgi:chorismate-pyruvate lyase